MGQTLRINYVAGTADFISGSNKVKQELQNVKRHAEGLHFILPRHLAHLAEGGIGLHAIGGAFGLATAAAQAFQGNMEGVVKSIEGLPFGIGHVIKEIGEFVKVFSGIEAIEESGKKLAEDSKKQYEALAESVKAYTSALKQLKEAKDEADTKRGHVFDPEQQKKQFDIGDAAAKRMRQLEDSSKDKIRELRESGHKRAEAAALSPEEQAKLSMRAQMKGWWRGGLEDKPVGELAKDAQTELEVNRNRLAAIARDTNKRIQDIEQANASARLAIVREAATEQLHAFAEGLDKDWQALKKGAEEGKQALSKLGSDIWKALSDGYDKKQKKQAEGQLSFIDSHVPLAELSKTLEELAGIKGLPDDIRKNITDEAFGKYAQATEKHLTGGFSQLADPGGLVGAKDSQDRVWRAQIMGMINNVQPLIDNLKKIIDPDGVKSKIQKDNS